jgi:hypothetical protein
LNRSGSNTIIYLGTWMADKHAHEKCVTLKPKQWDKKALTDAEMFLPAQTDL